MLSVLLVAFFLLLALGVPVGFAMGVAALTSLASTGELPLLVLAQRMFVAVDSFPLLAIPFFIAAGEFMEKGGISRRLVDFAASLVGHFRGGLAMAAVLASMIFAGISGSAVADASAIGSVTIPAMLRRGYPAGFVASLQAAAGCLGPIIPPSSLMIIYGAITGVSIGAMFLGGAIPGIIMGLGLMAFASLYARRRDILAERRATVAQVWRSFRQAAWALVMPGIIIGGILTGVFTPTEAGAVAAAYAFLVGLFVYRGFGMREVPAILADAAHTTAIVMFIISAAGAFGWILGREEFPARAGGAILAVTSDPTSVLLLIVAFLLLVGCFVEVVAAAIILIPVLFPIGAQLGYQDVYFAVIIVMTLVLGALTPPVGVVLFVTVALARCRVSDTLEQAYTCAFLMLAVILLCVAYPPLITWLPDALFR
jgi:C4-dicarboxylate transporter DctM subunit